MPAHRSEAEADLRVPTVARLREILPGCRIIHEINAGSFGPNRIDVMAVSETRILTAEIKSAKDKLTRLPAQIRSMRSVSHGCFAVLHEKFLKRLGRQPGWYPPEEARNAVVWVWPQIDRPSSHVECSAYWIERDRWQKPKVRLTPPPGALDLLWREELYEACRAHGIPAMKKHTMSELTDKLIWALTGEEMTRMICGTLRRRACTEADPPIG